MIAASFLLGLALTSGLVQAQPLRLADSAVTASGDVLAADAGSLQIVRRPVNRLTVVPRAAAAGESRKMVLVAQHAAAFARITSAQLASMLLRKDFLLVNVHIPYEGEIAGTDAFIPYDKITDNLDKLPKDISAKIVLYCRSGHMSEIAARELARLGYIRVSDLAGGMINWKKSGHDVIER